MNKPIRNAGIAAIVYILTVMWVVQDVLMTAIDRAVTAFLFFMAIMVTVLITKANED